MFHFSESSYNDIMLLIFCLLLASVVTKNLVGTATVWQNVLPVRSALHIHKPFYCNVEAACSLNQGSGLLCPVTEQVYDIAFSRAGGGRDMFASVGADGSVRMFDLRHLEHSTIIYEDPQHHPLLRLCWNKQDPNYLATMAMDGMEVRASGCGYFGRWFGSNW